MFVQRSFDDLGTPLAHVTFCVLDLETTGTSPEEDAITEIGAVKVRGGECVGTFHTLVDPERPVPRGISLLTGITDTLVERAPTVAAVLGSLLSFVDGTVIVGHNVRFDISFLQAALARGGYPALANPRVDTCALARRLLQDEAPNCRLGTLAARLRLDHRPTHRAFDDALATVDLLHLLLERAAAFGVFGLDDLLAVPTMAGHPQAAKLKLTASLPRRPGVYVFRGRGGHPLYVGTATNLRARVRSYFSGDTRRKVGPLLREVDGLDHHECAHSLEAAVLEIRLIHELTPPYNRHGTRWRSASYVKLTAGEPFPRLAVARSPRDDGGAYLGPVASARTARLVIDAIESVVPLRRCTLKPRGTPLRDAPCAPAQLGVATCPCAGAITANEYAVHVRRARMALQTAPELLLEPLRTRLQALARAERFEEAADVRDRAEALAGVLRRQRRLEGLRASGRLVVQLPDRSGAELVGGRLERSWGPAPAPPGAGAGAGAGLQLELDGGTVRIRPPPDNGAPPAPIPRAEADELACVASWLDRNAARVRLVHCEGVLATPVPALPSFAPRAGPAP
jgi:DNA polymerase-3 subunit epsilon